MLFSSILPLILAATASASLESNFQKHHHHHARAASHAVVDAPVRKHTREGATLRHIVDSDRSRTDQYRKGKSPVQIENAVVTYLSEVGFGTPATNYSLIVDTGSSNTFAKNFKVTSDAVNSGHNVSVTYGSGSFSGKEYTDTVTLGPGLVIKKQGVARATKSTGFDAYDGILGVGPVNLTRGTVDGEDTVPTVIDNAVAQGLIGKNILGVYFEPTDDENGSPNGLLTYGGIAQPRITSDVTYTPKSTNAANARWWGINIKGNLGSGVKHGIVDTGTTLMILPDDWVQSYLSQVPDATIDQNQGIIRFPKKSLSKVPDITFTVSGKDFVINKYAQLIPQALYSAFGLSNSYYYAWITSSGSSTSFSFILGQKFLERYYSVYDTEAERVGFASTKNSNPTTVP